LKAVYYVIGFVKLSTTLTLIPEFANEMSNLQPRAQDPVTAYRPFGGYRPISSAGFSKGSLVLKWCLDLALRVYNRTSDSLWCVRV